jgi:hypothetical protein
MKNILLLVLCPISNFSLVGKYNYGNYCIHSHLFGKPLAHVDIVT